MNIEISPERKIKYLRQYMNVFIDLWPKKPKPFDRWLESTLDKKYNHGKKEHQKKKQLVCRYCRRQFDEYYLEKTKDHIVPVSRGGLDKKENRVPCCKECNTWKDDKSLENWFKEIRLMVKKEKVRKPYTIAQMGLILGAIKQLIEQVKKENKKVSLYKI